MEFGALECGVSFHRALTPAQLGNCKQQIGSIGSPKADIDFNAKFLQNGAQT